MITSENRLHSQYNPGLEAARYLDQIISGRHPSCVIILGGAEDWLSEAARARFPASLILSLQYAPGFRGKERPGASARWYPDDPVGLDAFLVRELSGRMDGGIAVVPWNPSAAAFPHTADRVLGTVKAILEELTSDSATLRYWSRRWSRNSLKTFLNGGRFLTASQKDGPILIAAAGPSLEDALRAFLPFRDRVRLWALASAASACLRLGWMPELFVSTDAGFWSDRHFDSIRRTIGDLRIPVACPLTAHLPLRVLEDTPLVLLSQGHPFHEELPAAAGIPVATTAARGTAAADAVSLALASTRGPVLLAGFDLASLDLRSHCRPYGFDSVIRKPEKRLRPYLAILWERETKAFPDRSGAWRRGRSFDLYASAAARQGSERIYRFLPSPVPVPGAVPAAEKDLPDLLSGPSVCKPSFQPADAPSREARVRIARNVLDSWESAALSVLNAKSSAPLADRERLLLYALGGADAAGFLAQASRGIRDGPRAEEAAAAVRRSAEDLRGLAS